MGYKTLLIIPIWWEILPYPSLKVVGIEAHSNFFHQDYGACIELHVVSLHLGKLVGLDWNIINGSLALLELCVYVVVNMDMADAQKQIHKEWWCGNGWCVPCNLLSSRRISHCSTNKILNIVAPYLYFGKLFFKLNVNE